MLPFPLSRFPFPALLAALLLLTSGAARAAPPPGPLRVGVVAVEGADRAKADGARLAAYLGKALGRKGEVRVYTDYLQFASDFQLGRVDAAWLTPVLAVRAVLADAKLVARVARAAGPSYRSALFTKADSPASTPAQLKKARAAWVAPGSAAGYVFPVAMLSKQKLLGKLAHEQFFGSHDAVCRAVLAGQADLGATFADLDAAGKLHLSGCESPLGPEAAKLKVLATSEPIPADALALRPDIDEPTLKRLKQIALAMAGDAEGKALLAEVFHAKQLIEAKPEDYEGVAAALEVSDRHHVK